MNGTPCRDSPGLIALIPRSAALFILLYQIRFLALDMADTPVFVAALFGAFFTAFFLCRIKIAGRLVRPAEALLVMALVPWSIRFLVAFPRWFVPGVSGAGVLLDSLLLNLDRNNFSALLPFYWAAVTSYFSLRSRVFLRADIIGADILFLVLFSAAPSASMEVYRWPILMIGLLALVLFLQILSLVFSLPPEMKLRKREGTAAGIFLFLLIFLGGAFFIRPFQEQAVERGGGLLEPNLFQFDFSQVLRLESEISMNDDLVMIVRKDSGDDHYLLRRYTLSSYVPGRGFSRHETIDEAAHLQRLPDRRVRLPGAGIDKFRVTDQEYYIVNFDASAFIGMNMPVEIIPFETWDASSFNSAYGVKSFTSLALPNDLISAVYGEAGPDSFGMSPEEYAFYTDYGGDAEIASFTDEIIRNAASMYRSETAAPLSSYEKIQMIYYNLKYGEYRYSLKPGIAPDGDQLKYFLFDSRKGYCSYFAFAFTLMLRSQGIPCRVAAGFFMDPMTEAFNYFPVRADMAHAWVEVWFPGYGWIEYDPTTQTIAEGEEVVFSQGTPPELFERLMKEILDNRSRLRAKEGEADGDEEGGLAGLGKTTLRFLARRGLFIALAALLVLFSAARSGFLWLFLICKDERKKARFLWAHVRRRLALAGYRKPANEGEGEWAAVLERRFGGVYALYGDNAAARFAAEYSSAGRLAMEERYRFFCGGYRKALPRRRRFLAWLLPPLALLLKAPRSGPSARRRLKSAGTILFIFVFLLLRGEAGRAQDEPSLPETAGRADELYENAMDAELAENWDRAIGLLSEGARLYPEDFRFTATLGNLYYERGLYRLAWDEFRRTEAIVLSDSFEPSYGAGGRSEIEAALLFKLAYTAGYLNMNESSTAYLERILELTPDNKEAIGVLGWMYFKIHRFSDGERLFLDAMERMGEDAEFSMSLGHIYSALFRYGEAKEAYLRAIEISENSGDRLLEALSYYNLSILESRFYEYSLSFDCTNASLEVMNRPSGRLARGELYLRRMELSRALGDYQEAYATDSSPLSKLNLAQVFQAGGRLAEAALYAEDCLGARDESWMLNYGIDPDRYKRDVHEILKDTYEGLFRAEALSGTELLFHSTPKEAASSLFRKISYRFRWAVHTHLFRKYSLLSADAYPVGGGVTAGFHPDALIHYFEAFDAYPARALAYLGEVRGFEESLIPGSVPGYTFEEGRVLRDRELIVRALEEFDPLWERDMIADAYAELARRGNGTERRDAAERLFALNRGALARNGIRLPVNLRVTGNGGALRRAARAAGMEPVSGVSGRYTLTLGREDGGNTPEGKVYCELYDGGRGIVVFRGNLDFSPAEKETTPRAARAAFIRALRDGIFDAF